MLLCASEMMSAAAARVSHKLIKCARVLLSTGGRDRRSQITTTQSVLSIFALHLCGVGRVGGGGGGAAPD